MNRKFIIYGFGRMGLTHYAILNQIVENAEFVFIDVNKKVNYFARRNLSAKILSSDIQSNDPFDYALICTPPMYHIELLKCCIQKGISKIFVEKPFGGVNDDFSIEQNSNHIISVGYVLRFNPIIQWVKSNIDINEIVKVEGNYFSNTIEKKPVGWRNGSYSGVTNEMGSHILDLCVYLFDMTSPKIVDKNVISVISDLDDILTAHLIDKSINYHFHFDWVNKNYRKPVLNFVLSMKDGSVVKFDQQKIELIDKNCLSKRVSVSDIDCKVPFYLRGVEFTNQMIDFVGSRRIMATYDDAILSRNIIKQLINP
jgi:predicted dehydrogenase